MIGLPATIPDLARLLRVDTNRLRALACAPYRRFTRPKRDGRERPIADPSEPLKSAQRILLDEIWSHFPVHDAAHGYVKNRSALTNARAHAGAALLLTFDIQGFFPAFTRARVAAYLAAHGAFSDVADMLAVLATAPRRDGSRVVCQGAPTSPAITNALSRQLDIRLAALAAKHAAVYTRYADDLTFSWRHAPLDAAVEAVRRWTPQILKNEGFRTYKPQTMRACDQQMVTGYVINAAPGAAEVRVPRKHVRALRRAIREGDDVDLLRGRVGHVVKADPSKAGLIAALDRRRGGA